MLKTTVVLVEGGKWRCGRGELLWEEARRLHEGGGQVRGCSWGLARRAGRKVEATAREFVRYMRPGCVQDMVVGVVELGAVDSGGLGEGRQPGYGKGVREVEWVGGDMQRCGCYTEVDCQSPNAAVFGWARRDQPSLHMPDKIRSGHAAMYDRALGLDTTTDAPRTKRQKPVVVAGGSWVTERPRQWQRSDGGPVHRASADGWPDKICRRQPNPRHGLEGGRVWEASQGRCSEAKVGCRTGALLSRARTQPWAGASYHGAGEDYPKLDKASRAESRAVYASTLGAGRPRWRYETGRANEGDRARVRRDARLG